MKRTKGQSGITLIALVVTIVVLLILAGITINYVLSDGGIFGSAQKAKLEQEAAGVRDYTSNGVGSVIAESFNPTETAQNYDTLMKKSFPDGYKPDLTEGGSAISCTKGKVTGEFTVQVGDDTTNVYTVNITDGKVTVTPPSK